MKKTVIITGGANGIGRAIAQKGLETDHYVVIADKDLKAGQACLDILNYPKDLEFISADVRKESEAEKIIQETIHRWGKIDALINNAGITDPAQSPMDELELSIWNDYLQTNLTGSFLMAKHAIPHLKQTKGAIVNITSTRAIQSEPDTEAYAASKGGLVALTHAMAISLGPDIRVNCISPGWIDVRQWQSGQQESVPPLRKVDHQQHPTGRAGNPMDVAEMALYLVSEKAGFITGSHIVVDGGMTRKMIYAE